MKKLLAIAVLFAAVTQNTSLDAREHCALGFEDIEHAYFVGSDRSQRSSLNSYTCEGRREPLHLGCSEGFVWDDLKKAKDKYRYRCIKREFFS